MEAYSFQKVTLAHTVHMEEIERVDMTLEEYLAYHDSGENGDPYITVEVTTYKPTLGNK